MKNISYLLVFILMLALLNGCGGGASSNESSYESGSLSEVLSDETNDTNSDGIRDVVETAINEISEDEVQSGMLLDAAKKQQEVIDKYIKGHDIEDALMEYKKSFYCLSVYNIDEYGLPKTDDVALLNLVTLASTNNSANFADIASSVNSTEIDMELEDCQ